MVCCIICSALFACTLSISNYKAAFERGYCLEGLPLLLLWELIVDNIIFEPFLFPVGVSQKLDCHISIVTPFSLKLWRRVPAHHDRVHCSCSLSFSLIDGRPAQLLVPQYIAERKRTLTIANSSNTSTGCNSRLHFSSPVKWQLVWISFFQAASQQKRQTWRVSFRSHHLCQLPCLHESCRLQAGVGQPALLNVQSLRSFDFTIKLVTLVKVFNNRIWAGNSACDSLLEWLHQGVVSTS